MQQALTFTTRRITLYAAVFAMAALVVTVLAVSFATGSAQAQANTDPRSNADAYPFPHPCGAGFPNAFPEEPAQAIKEGQLALFDAYWDFDSESLNNNQCPYAVSHTVKTDRGGKRTLTGSTRSVVNADIRTTVFEVSNHYKHTVTEEDKNKYDFFPPVGTKVWWVKSGAPLLDGETTDLALAFSTALFKDAHWDSPDGTPLQYEFEAERDPDANTPDFFAFVTGAVEPEWDSRNADTNEAQMRPGEYKHVNWVFLANDTYVLDIHIKGHVRLEPPEGRTEDNWKPITWPDGVDYKENEEAADLPPEVAEAWDALKRTVTSQVKEYVINIGSEPDPQPRVGLRVSIPETLPVTDVGDPIPIIPGDLDALTAKLTGTGNTSFRAELADNGRAVQIKVADGASLDYEQKDTYNLRLKVGDGKNVHGDVDDSVDLTIPVRIDLQNVGDGIYLVPSKTFLKVGETVAIALVHEVNPGVDGVYPWRLQEGTFQWFSGSTANPVPSTPISGNPTRSYSATETTPGVRCYAASVNYADGVGHGGEAGIYHATPVCVTWWTD